MRKRILNAAIFCLSVLIASSQLGAITPEKPEFRKLADDVYAYIGKVNDANALVVVQFRQNL